jgi:diacylglycerol diphosphate phosphatase/phosphatidate phosphatase
MLVLAFGMMGHLQPFCQPFMANDPALSYPFAEKETVPNRLLTVLTVPVPLVWLAVIHKMRFKSVTLYIAFLTLLEALALTAVITESIKVYQGRLRPDWLSRLQRDNVVALPNMFASILCDRRSIREGRVSFPSGHSSSIFTTCTLVSLHSAAQLRVFRPGQGNLWKLLLVLSPFILAVWVAGSRTRDHRHNFDDVSAGAAIGIAIAFLSYRLHFPPLSDERCNHPHILSATMENEMEQQRRTSADTATNDQQCITPGALVDVPLQPYTYNPYRQSV